tara:strand:- start:2514 stop:3008 length:495 start_codon:yes stop_codon:yes gene_type:complete
MASVEELEGEVRGMAMDVDQQMGQQIAASTPEGDFSERSLDRLARSLNKIRQVFGAEPIPDINTDMDMLPEDMARTLMMLQQISDDARLKIDLDLDNLMDDQGLTILAGKVDAMLEDRNLMLFLQQERAGTEPEEEEIPMEEPAEMPAQPMADADMDALMMERM